MATTITNKVKSFLWRVCNDGLPTKRQLSHRKIIASGICDFCHATNEDIFHALFKCPSISQIWAKSFERDISLLELHSRFDNRIWAVIGLHDLHIFSRFVIIAWGYRKFRNLRIFHNSEASMFYVVAICFSYVESYLLV